MSSLRLIRPPVLVGSFETDESAVTSLPLGSRFHTFFLLYFCHSLPFLFTIFLIRNRKIVFDKVWTKINPKQLLGFEDSI